MLHTYNCKYNFHCKFYYLLYINFYLPVNSLYIFILNELCLLGKLSYLNISYLIISYVTSYVITYINFYI